MIDVLDFSTPEGLRFHVSSLSAPNFATSYTLGSIGLVDGSLSYLYSSLPLSRLAAKSSAIGLHHLVPGYRQLQDLRQPDEPWWWEIWHQGKRIDRRGESDITEGGPHANAHSPLEQRPYSMADYTYLDLLSKLSTSGA